MLLLLLLLPLASAAGPQSPRVKWRLQLGSILHEYSRPELASRARQLQATLDCDNSENQNKACLKDIQLFLQNIKDVLNFRIGQGDVYETQYKRLSKFIDIANNKASKNATFDNVTSALLSSLGGNASNMTCEGQREYDDLQSTIGNKTTLPKFVDFRGIGTDRNQSKLANFISDGTKIYNVLQNCSDNVQTYCEVKNTTIANFKTKWRTCNELNNAIIVGSNDCANRTLVIDEQAKCYCYQSLVSKVQRFRDLKCPKISVDTKQVKKIKTTCTDNFKICRQMENMAFFIINTCDHKEVPLYENTSRSLDEVIQEEEDEEEEDID